VTLAFAMRALRQHIVVILVTVLVVTGAGIAIGYSWPKTYTSHSQILLGLDIAGSTIDPQTASLYLKDRAMTYAQLVTADEVIAPVAAATGINPEVLRDQVVGSIVPETVVLGVSATGSTPEEAVALTQALSSSFQTQVSSLNVRTGGPAILPAQLSSPQPAVAPDQLHGKMLVAVSALAGLIIGALLALVLGLIDAGRASRRSAQKTDQVKVAATKQPPRTDPNVTREPMFGELGLADDMPKASPGTDRRGRVPYLTIGRNNEAAHATRKQERKDHARERSTNGSQTAGRHSGDDFAHDR